MKSHLQSFTIRIKTLGPLFIGSGREINKKEYAYIPVGQRVCIIDLQRFSRFLNDKGLEDRYITFMLGNQNDLYQWLYNCRVTDEEVNSFTAYEISAGNALKSDHPLRDIELFLKDNYGQPYLPGSSLKGAIRTAILAKMLASQRNQSLRDLRKWEEKLRRSEWAGKNALGWETERVEADLLHTLNLDNNKYNAVNSVMKGLQISDSRSASTTDLILCPKIDLTLAGKEIAVPTFREAIRPGVTLLSQITLDPLILEQAGIDMGFIESAIREFANMQEQYFFSAFLKLPANTDNSKAEPGAEIYLGGGAGYLSKTVAYPMGGKEAISFVALLMQKQFSRGHHDKDMELGVSPHVLKGTYYDNKFYRMGRCSVEIA
ncbi:MAG: type III-A CRISPR-associated RAMP protein Csm5 [Syntrophomonadales bacterium]|jgi:CRISPR-associated protein Csm5